LDPESEEVQVGLSLDLDVATPTTINYLIVDELVHLRESNHTPAFWRRVQTAIPDYLGRKRWLAENGGAATRL
jgi:hypothetical protein